VKPTWSFWGAPRKTLLVFAPRTRKVVESPGPSTLDASQLDPAGAKSSETALTWKAVGTTIWIQPMAPPPPPGLVFVATSATGVG
jgi:hypothetical protein